MSFGVNQSTQFKINEIVIVTKNGKIDISGIFKEINIYDSLFMPVMSGSISVIDSIGLSGKLIFDGSETLLIDIVKDYGSDVLNFKKAFRIYRQKDRKNNNMNSEEYVLNFVSDELIYSDQQRINQSYEDTYSNIVKKIMVNYLKIPENNLKGVYEDSLGIKKIVIPNLRPIDAIQWCTKRSLDKNYSPDFMFFQNITGYNFVTLSTLLTNPKIIDVKFEPKNIQGKNDLQEISIARSMEILQQNDTVENIRSGVLAGKFIGFDPLTRTISTKEIGYLDHYRSMKHGNENPNVSKITNRANQYNDLAYNSKKTVSTFSLPRQLSNYIKKYDPTSLSKEESIESFLFQRQAIIKNLTNRRMKFVMPGNFQLSSGFNVNAIIPNLSVKENGSDNLDMNLSGKYIIIGSRQKIGFDRHETIIEVATSSTANEFIPISSPVQTEEILNY
jgi:hypothetical protein